MTFDVQPITEHATIDKDAPCVIDHASLLRCLQMKGSRRTGQAGHCAGPVAADLRTPTPPETAATGRGRRMRGLFPFCLSSLISLFKALLALSLFRRVQDFFYSPKHGGDLK